MPTTLYAFIEQRPNHPWFGRPFYIGIGTKDRPKRHLRNARRTAKMNDLLGKIVRSHERLHLAPKLQVLAVCQSRECASDCEQRLIAVYGRRSLDADGILCNLARGGDGPDSSLMQLPSIRRKLSDASKVRYSSATERAAQAARLKAAYERPETRRAVSDATKKALREPANRARHLDALRMVNKDLTTDKRRQAALDGFRKNPERRAQFSAAAKAAWADPIIRAKRIAAMSAARSRKRLPKELA